MSETDRVLGLILSAKRYLGTAIPLVLRRDMGVEYYDVADAGRPDRAGWPASADNAAGPARWFDPAAGQSFRVLLTSSFQISLPTY